MREYRKLYKAIIEILKKHGKYSDKESLISLRLNTKEVIIFNCENGCLLKTITGKKETKPMYYYRSENVICCSLTMLKTLFNQLEFRFNS